MTLRCRPGDLAIVTGRPKSHDASHLMGRMVRVIHLSPMHRHDLPGGTVCAHTHPETPQWLVDFGKDVAQPRTDGSFRLRRYGCVGDSLLTPIRPEPDPADVTQADEVSA